MYERNKFNIELRDMIVLAVCMLTEQMVLVKVVAPL